MAGEASSGTRSIKRSVTYESIGGVRLRVDATEDHLVDMQSEATQVTALYLKMMRSIKVIATRHGGAKRASSSVKTIEEAIAKCYEMMETRHSCKQFWNRFVACNTEYEKLGAKSDVTAVWENYLAVTKEFETLMTLPVGAEDIKAFLPVIRERIIVGLDAVEERGVLDAEEQMKGAIDTLFAMSDINAKGICNQFRRHFQNAEEARENGFEAAWDGFERAVVMAVSFKFISARDPYEVMTEDFS